MRFGLIVAVVLAIGLLVLAGCTSSSNSVPRAPPAPSGGGCGIAAPAGIAPAVAEAADTVDGSAAL